MNLGKLGGFLLVVGLLMLLAGFALGKPYQAPKPKQAPCCVKQAPVMVLAKAEQPEKKAGPVACKCGSSCDCGLGANCDCEEDSKETVKKSLPCGKEECNCGCEDGEACRCAAQRRVVYYRNLYYDYLARGFSPNYVSARTAYRQWQYARQAVQPNRRVVAPATYYRPTAPTAPQRSYYSAPRYYSAPAACST